MPDARPYARAGWVTGAAHLVTGRRFVSDGNPCVADGARCVDPDDTGPDAARATHWRYPPAAPADPDGLTPTGVF